MNYFNKLKTKEGKTTYKLFLRFLKNNNIYNTLYKNSKHENIMTIINHINNGNHNERNINIWKIANIPITNINKISNKWENFYITNILNKTKIQIVTDFLKKYRIKTKFETYIKNDKHINLQNYVDNTPLRKIIENAFTWKYTEENFNFWNNIDDKYYTYIYNVLK